MPKDNKNKRIEDLKKLALAKGNDSDLLLLDLIHELQDALEELKDRKDPTDEEKIEKIASRIAVKMAIIDKGESGETGEQGTQGEKGDKGERGEMGEKGKDGKMGLIGLNGKDGIDGKEGVDGKDGKDGKNVEENKVKELVKEIKDLEKRTKTAFANQGRVQTPRYVHTPMVDVFTGDGSNKAFTLTKAPKSLDTVKGWGSDFPHILVNGSDGGFTITGKTLTLNDVVDAPSLDARFVIEYYV